MFYRHKTNSLIRSFYPSSFIWDLKKKEEKKIYLTFDDGPIPSLTEFVLEELAKYNAKATFFCVGHNIQKHPSIFNQLIQQNHQIGNHTFYHRNGWKTKTKEYVKDIEKCNELISEKTGIKCSLFRPPYGLITRRQVRNLSSYKIIMWDMLSGDFDQKIKKEKVLEKSIKYTESGSIALFHDNIKATTNIKHTLPFYLDHFHQLGYQFAKLEL